MQIDNPDQPFTVGRNIFIRTVTMIITGKLLAVGDKELVVGDAAWIADTGRYTQALATGNFEEVEVYPSGEHVFVGRGALIDAQHVNWELPVEQK
jgi:hypothetical protein